MQWLVILLLFWQYLLLFSRKYKAAAESFIRNKVDELKEAEPVKAFKVLKSMGAQPGDCKDDYTFTLPSAHPLHPQPNSTLTVD